MNVGGYIGIRNNFLIKNRVGNSINSFYYNHSPFAAETIKPLAGKTQFTILYIGNDKKVTDFFSNNRIKMKFVAIASNSKKKISRYLTNGGIDIVLIDTPEMENLSGFIQERFKKIFNSSTIFLSNNKVIENRPETLKNPQIVKPLSIKKINSSIGTLSTLSDHSKGIRYLIKLSLFDFLNVQLFGLTLLFILLIASVVIQVFPAKQCASYKKTCFALLFLSFFLTFTIWANQNRMGNEKPNRLEKIKKTDKNSQIKPLISIANSNDDDNRYQALYHLSKILTKKNRKNRDISKTLLKSMNDNDPRIRLYAAIGLGNLGVREAVPVLIRALDDPQINVRYKSAEALGKIRDSRAKGPLKRVIAENGIWYVSNYALAALKKIY